MGMGTAVKREDKIEREYQRMAKTQFRKNERKSMKQRKNRQHMQQRIGEEGNGRKTGG